MCAQSGSRSRSLKTLPPSKSSSNRSRTIRLGQSITNFWTLCAMRSHAITAAMTAVLPPPVTMFSSSPSAPSLRLAQNLVRIDHPQERLPLMRPERARPRRLVVVLRGQKLDVLVRVRLQARHPVPPPVAEGILILCEAVEHGSAHLDLGGPESLAAHVVLHLAGDALLAAVGNSYCACNAGSFLPPAHEGIPRRAAKIACRSRSPTAR